MKSSHDGLICQGWKSHPARGAWIEICISCGCVESGDVAPRKGCVD